MKCRKSRNVRGLHDFSQAKHLNGVQEVAGSNPVAPTSQGSPAQEVAVSLALCPSPVFAPCHFVCHFSPDKTGRNGYSKGGEGVGWSDANQITAAPSAHAFSEGFILEEASMPRRPKPFFHRGWWCTNVQNPVSGVAFKSAIQAAISVNRPIIRLLPVTSSRSALLHPH